MCVFFPARGAPGLSEPPCLRQPRPCVPPPASSGVHSQAHPARAPLGAGHCSGDRGRVSTRDLMLACAGPGLGSLCPQQQALQPVPGAPGCVPSLREGALAPALSPRPCLGEPCRDTPAPSPSRWGADAAPTAPEGGLAAPAAARPQPRWLTPSHAVSCRPQVPAAIPGRGQGAAALPRRGGAARVGRPVGAAVATRAVHVPERQGPAHQHWSAPRGPPCAQGAGRGASASASR